MKAHPITPCLSRLIETIVPRTILFLGVQIVPVNTLIVDAPFSDKVLAQWGWPTLLIVFSHQGGKQSITGYRRVAPTRTEQFSLHCAVNCLFSVYLYILAGSINFYRTWHATLSHCILCNLKFIVTCVLNLLCREWSC